MAKQLAWIFRSYLTRPIFIVGLGVWAILQIAMFVAGWLDSRSVPLYPQISPRGMVDATSETTNASIREMASQFPKAQTVAVYIPHRLAPSDIVPFVNQLNEFQHLRELVLRGHIQTLEDLKPLEELHELNTIDLSELVIARPNGRFPRLQNLTKLIIGSQNAANDQFVKEIATLPALHQLILVAQFGDDPSDCVTIAGIRELKKSKSLRSLYLSQVRFSSRPSKWNNRQLPIVLAAELQPKVLVQSAYRDHAVHTLPTILFVMSAIIGFFCGVQLASQRASLYSWMTPGHRAIPLIALGMWIALLSAISVSASIFIDFNPLIVFLIHLCCMTVGTVVGLITLSPFLPTGIRVLPALLINVGFVSLIAFHPDVDRLIPIDDFARGAFQLQGMMAVLTILVALASILSLVYLPHYEYKPSVNPFRVIARGDSGRTPRPLPRLRGPALWLFKAHDRRVEDAISPHRLHTTAGRIERWRAAMPTGGWSWWGSMLVTIVGISAISSLLPAPLSTSTRLGSLTPIFLMFPFMIGVAWRQRKRAMGFEFLHPISRTDFIRQIRTAFLRDLAPIFLWQAIIVLYIAYFGGIELLPIDIIRRTMILAPGLALLLTAIAASIVLVRSGWGIGAIYAFVCIFFAITMSFLVVMFRNDYILSGVSATTSLLSIFALVWMASLWRRIELGR